PGLALAAVGLETVDVDAYGQARLAVIAVRAIGKQAAAPETFFDQAGVGIGVDKVGGGGDLRTRIQAVQIAARVGCRSVELQGVEPCFGRVAHDYIRKRLSWK